MGWVLVPSFLRYTCVRYMDHTVISVVNIKFFIKRKLDKASWHCSIDPGSNTDNVSQLPPHRTYCDVVNFFGTYAEYFSVQSLSVATLSHSVLIEYIKNTQGHTSRSIPVVHSGNSAHSGPAGKRTHRGKCVKLNITGLVSLGYSCCSIIW